jgi:hypothetical protein
MILCLIHGFHGKHRHGQGSGCSEKRLKNADLAIVIGIAELDLGDGQVAGFGLVDDVFSKRMAEAIKMCFAGAARELVAAEWDIGKGRRVKDESGQNSAWPSAISAAMATRSSPASGSWGSSPHSSAVSSRDW